MRSIKFRAWIISEKEMESTCFAMSPEGDYWQFADQGFYINNKNEKPEFILMQYTGLKDKNGKEIYEGDIVKTQNLIAQVVYQAPEFVMKKKPKNKTWYSFIRIANDRQYEEIIGNIYENADLL